MEVNLMSSLRLLCWTGTLLLAALSPARTQPLLPQFVDAAESAGVSFHHQASHTSQKYLIETMGAGVALLDFNGDGLLDIYFANGAKLKDPMPSGSEPDKTEARFWNRLYQNKGGLQFEDVTEAAGVQARSYGMGVAVGDYDNDGDPDLYLTNYGRNLLYRNNGDGTFSDVTDHSGTGAGGWSSGSTFVDYDRDGRLDLFVARYLDWEFSNNIPCGEGLPEHRSYCHPRRFGPASHLLFWNRGEGKFEDVSHKTGIAAHPGKGLGVALTDYDGDGWIDTFVANDSYPQQLFRNVRGQRFEEAGIEAGVAYDADGRDFAGMGAAFGDYDNDGQPDLVVNALARQSYWLFRNGRGEFSSATRSSGLGRLTDMHSGWGMGLVDFDNDGWRDLFVAQGHVMDDIERTDPGVAYKEPFLLLKNIFGRFFNVSEGAGSAFRAPRAGRGAAFGDLDNDGRVDVVVNENQGRAVVLRNNTAQDNHWLTVELVGTESNRDGIGARIELQPTSGPCQTAWVGGTGSYLSAGDRRVHFGLGHETALERLVIYWPSGTRQVIREPLVDQLHRVREDDSQRAP